MVVASAFVVFRVVVIVPCLIAFTLFFSLLYLSRFLLSFSVVCSGSAFCCAVCSATLFCVCLLVDLSFVLFCLLLCACLLVRCLRACVLACSCFVVACMFVVC